MRILLISAYFPPENGSASHLFHEMGRELAARGHHITVLTGMPAYHVTGAADSYAGHILMREQMDGMEVVRMAGPHFARNNMLGRGVWQLASACTTFISGITLPKHDVALVYSPPLFLGLTAWLFHLLRGTPFVLNVQDLFPQSAIDLEVLKNIRTIANLQQIERFVYHKAAHITVHSPGNKLWIQKLGVLSHDISIIPNWVDTGLITPGPRYNSFRSEHGLEGKKVISFAGAIGYSMGLDTVLEAASLMREQSDLIFLLVGDGVEVMRLKAKVAELQLINVRFLPMQAKENYPEVLRTSDVSLVSLSEKVKTPVVPSKIGSIMAAGRPIVALLDPASDAAHLIQQAQAGLVVAPGDASALADAISGLLADPVRMEQFGANGRSFAEAHLSISTAADTLEKLLEYATFL